MCTCVGVKVHVGMHIGKDACICAHMCGSKRPISGTFPHEVHCLPGTGS